MTRKKEEEKAQQPKTEQERNEEDWGKNKETKQGERSREETYNTEDKKNQTTKSLVWPNDLHTMGRKLLLNVITVSRLIPVPTEWKSLSSRTTTTHDYTTTEITHYRSQMAVLPGADCFKAVLIALLHQQCTPYSYCKDSERYIQRYRRTYFVPSRLVSSIFLLCFPKFKYNRTAEPLQIPTRSVSNE